MLSVTLQKKQSYFSLQLYHWNLELKKHFVLAICLACLQGSSQSPVNDLSGRDLERYHQSSCNLFFGLGNMM